MPDEKPKDVQQVTVGDQTYDVPKEVFDQIRRQTVTGAQNKAINTMSKAIGVELPLGSKPDEIRQLIEQQVGQMLEEKEKQTKQQAATEQDDLKAEFARYKAELEQQSKQERAQMLELNYKNSVQAEMIQMGLLDEFKAMIPSMMGGFGLPKVSTTGQIEVFDPSNPNSYKLAENGESIQSSKQYAELFRAQYPQLFKAPKNMPNVGGGNGQQPGIEKKQFDIKNYKNRNELYSGLAQKLIDTVQTNDKNGVEM